MKDKNNFVHFKLINIARIAKLILESVINIKKSFSPAAQPYTWPLDFTDTPVCVSILNGYEASKE